MKLNWKLKKNGDEVAGPWRILPKLSVPGVRLLLEPFGHWAYYPTRAQAKRAAQRIADKILKNMEAK